jgi:hypothetical protein
MIFLQFAERNHAVASSRLNAGALKDELERRFGRFSGDGGISSHFFLMTPKRHATSHSAV